MLGVGIGGQGDFVAPTVLSATIGTNGATLTIVFSEAVVFSAGFSLNAVGSPSLIIGSGTGSATYVYNIGSPAVLAGAVVTLDYTPGNVADLAGNPLAAFSNAPVTNNSTVPEPGTFSRTAAASGTFVAVATCNHRFTARGGGGGGEDPVAGAGRGGGGGGLAQGVYSITLGDNLAWVVGAGGAANASGANSSVTKLSFGVFGGLGTGGHIDGTGGDGAANGGVSSAVTKTGGQGGDSNGLFITGGGGGAGAGLTGSNPAAAGAEGDVTGGAGGVGAGGGGSGGAGANAGGSGTNGSAPGGGGGGAGVGGTGGAGADGSILIEWPV